MRRLSLSLITVIVVSTISLGWLLNKIYLYSQPNSSDQLQAQYGVLGKQIVKVLINAPDQEHFIAHWNQSSDYYLYIIDKDNFPIPQELHKDFHSGKALVLESSNELALYYYLPPEGNVLAIALPHHPSQASKLELILTISFYVGVIIIILLWIWPLLKELGRLREASSRFGKGDLSARVAIKGFSYIADIEQEFNHMADHIQSLIADNKLLSRAVSHDLKTPLARLRFGLEALSETQNEQQKERYAQRINADLEEMETLIDTLLQYARLDESRLNLNLEKIQLNTFCQNLLDAFQLAPQTQPKLSVNDDNIHIVADRRYLSMLINNLIVNAIHYGHQHVLLNLSLQQGEVVLCVEDDGPGIAPAERENVLKPFWRGTQQKTSKEPKELSSSGKIKSSHGMGLAIALRISDWHRASIRISDSEALGGAKVCVHFQAAE
ncbi:Sensor protein RstB [Thalassocella blandensis]|nr:Sensor protein RstB [Thalassocella blandensis]